MKGDDYAVEFVCSEDIEPSPENDAIYGTVSYDEQMQLLLSSIRSRGLEEPIIVSADNYIISGHRRYFALRCLGHTSRIPVRRKAFSRADHMAEWHRILAEYNPQRIKSVGTLLKESLLLHAGDDPRALLKQREEISVRGNADFLGVAGRKRIRSISQKKQAFLRAVQKVVFDLREFWPLTIRQIHYNLLNNPPLTMTPKRSTFSPERYRYRNDNPSYETLIELLKPARCDGHIPMDCIDDPTRPKVVWNGFANLSGFVNQEMQGFLSGYHVDRQLDQPRHIELLGEKNTLMQIVKPVCEEFYVPFSLGRGYGSIPMFKESADRFKASGKKRMSLIVVSDYDPEGLDLADDAIRTLRDLWGLPVDYCRVAVTREQIDELGLAHDFNPAKESSSRFKSFVERTGGEQTWECEALPPRYLRDKVREAIVSNIDMEIYDETVSREEREAFELQKLRQEIVESFNI